MDVLLLTVAGAYCLRDALVKMNKSRTLQMGVCMCRGEQACAHTHTYTVDYSWPQGLNEKMNTHNWSKDALLHVLSRSTEHYSTEPIHCRIFCSSDHSFHWNTLRCCQPCSQRAIWWVFIRTYTVECRSAVECRRAYKWLWGRRGRQTQREGERTLTTR